MKAGKRLTKEEIEKIRNARMDGMSIRSITKLGFSRGSVSKYCSGLRDNNEKFIDTSMATNSWVKKTRKRTEIIINEAKKEWSIIKYDSGVMSLIALYWGEGSKRNGKSVILSNSDPGLLKAALNVIRRLCKNEISIDVIIFKEQNKTLCKEKWSTFLGIAPRIYIKECKFKKKHRLFSKYGVARLRVKKSTNLWHKIMTWIDCWRQEVGINENCQL